MTKRSGRRRRIEHSSPPPTPAELAAHLAGVIDIIETKLAENRVLRERFPVGSPQRIFAEMCDAQQERMLAALKANAATRPAAPVSEEDAMRAAIAMTFGSVGVSSVELGSGEVIETGATPAEVPEAEECPVCGGTEECAPECTAGVHDGPEDDEPAGCRLCNHAATWGDLCDDCAEEEEARA